jgi:hypothetical protein
METAHRNDRSHGLQNIRIYFLFKSGRLSANIKLTLYKALIRSVMSYASPAREFSADTHRMKLHCLLNNVLVLRTIGNYPRRTPVRDLHMVLELPYVYDVTKLCWQEAELIQSHKNENFHNTGQGEARHRYIRGLIWRRSSIRPFKWRDCRCSGSY